MTLPTQLDGLPEVIGALTVDQQGRVVSVTPGATNATPDGAAALVVAVNRLGEAGTVAGLGALVAAHLKGASTSLVAGGRADAILLVHLDPSRMTSAVEKAVKAWARGEAAPPPPLPRPAAATPAGPLRLRPPPRHEPPSLPARR